MPERTEHGYAFTNHYKIDPRIGGEKAYPITHLCHACQRNENDSGCSVQSRGPLSLYGCRMHRRKTGCINGLLFTQTSYKPTKPYLTLMQALLKKKKMLDGWFYHQMPDLNQNNLYVANYLIQHAIWTVEEFELMDGVLILYPYNDRRIYESL